MQLRYHFAEEAFPLCSVSHTYSCHCLWHPALCLLVDCTFLLQNVSPWGQDADSFSAVSSALSPVPDTQHAINKYLFKQNFIPTFIFLPPTTMVVWAFPYLWDYYFWSRHSPFRALFSSPSSILIISQLTPFLLSISSLGLMSASDSCGCFLTKSSPNFLDRRLLF